MQYVPPLGSSDPNAPYIEGNPAAGIRGSYPTAAGYEGTMREIVNAISGAGLTPDGSDLTQLHEAIQTMINARAPIASLIHYGVDSGGINSLVVDVSPDIDSYQPGLTLFLIPNSTNTGATTVNSNELGAKTVRQSNGLNGLQPGDIVGGKLAVMTYDGTYFRLIFSAATLAESSLVHAGVAGGSANAITAIVAPSITAYTQGMLFAVEFTATNNAAASANFNALGTKNIYDNTTGAALVGGECVAGKTGLFYYDGTNLRLLNPYTTAIFPAIGSMFFAWGMGGTGWTPAWTPGNTYSAAGISAGITSAGGSLGTQLIYPTGGTWKCLGYSYTGSASNDANAYFSGYFQRIA
jgi:hypothetical protein